MAYKFLYVTLFPFTIAAVHKTEICIKEIYQGASISMGADFISLARFSVMFVDKTLLIKRILEDPSKLILITYPSKWGKSVNLNMIKNFLEIEVREEGTTVPLEQACCYRLFKYGEINIPKQNYHSRLYIPPLIADHKDIMKKYLGRHPVILLDFEHHREQTYTYFDIFDEIIITVCRAFRLHEYMVAILDKVIRSRTATENQKAIANERLNKFIAIAEQNATEEDYINSIVFLSELLHDHFRKPVYIFIDGYDSPLNKTIQITNDSSSDDDKVMNFYTTLIRQTLLDNRYLEKGILTGILRLNKHVLNMPSVTEYNFLNNGLHLYYGFSALEVTKLFNKIFVVDIFLKEVLDTYKHEWTPNEPVYNPYAIARLIGQTEARNYWAQAVKSNFTYAVVRYMPFRDVCADILKQGKYQLEHNNLQFDKQTLKRMMYHVKNNIPNSTIVNTIVTYFVATGYFLFTSNTYDETEPTAWITYPNNDVRSELSLDLLIAECDRRRVPYHNHESVRNVRPTD